MFLERGGVTENVEESVPGAEYEIPENIQGVSEEVPALQLVRV